MIYLVYVRVLYMYNVLTTSAGTIIFMKITNDMLENNNSNVTVGHHSMLLLIEIKTRSKS